jgi:hypothetical protein
VTSADQPSREALARALHRLFEGFVSHLPADDPDWLRYADQLRTEISSARASSESETGSADHAPFSQRMTEAMRCTDHANAPLPISVGDRAMTTLKELASRFAVEQADLAAQLLTGALDAIDPHRPEISAILDRLPRVMRPEFIPVWLASPVDALDGRRPLDLLARGEHDAVARVVSSLESPGAV